MIEATFDAARDALNIKWYHISLRQFDDMVGAVIGDDPEHSFDEHRLLAIGWIGAKLYVGCFTMPGDVPHVFSLRPATRREMRIYDEEA